jgi:MSHA biogenesis protein MshO
MEAVLVIALTGIVAVMVGVFIRAPITAYVDQARRAELSDVADTALRRIAREVQHALPNSVRTSGGALEFLPVTAGGRYRAAPRADGSGDFLDVDSATDNSFEVLDPGGVSATAGQRLVIYNLSESDAYGGASSRVLTSNGSGLSTLAYTVGGTQFPFASPSHRFQVIGSPVSFVCDGSGSLRRYGGYAMQAAQPTSTSAPPLSTAGSNSLLARFVGSAGSDCSFSYTAVGERNALLTLRLKLTANGESVTLLQQVHVSISP